MDGMNMGDMDMGGGLDSSSDTNFVGTNMYIAAVYWILIGSAVGVLLVLRLIELSRRSWRKRRARKRLTSTITRPGNFLSQIYDTTKAIFRELSYPQFMYSSHSFGKYFSPPSLGKCLLLCVYWLVILTMLWSNTILTPESSLYAYKWEIVGFRAAWVTVSQLPLIYCLSCKINVISLITGISYERLNWLHRWVARTLFLTAIVHWSFFFTEWTIADFVSLELSMMPMVIYGFGAWGVVTWMVLSGFGYFRSKQYELFVWQHLASAGVLLWLVWVHVPAYATYNVWLAIAFVAFDRCARLVWTLYRNLHLPVGSRTTRSAQRPLIGYNAALYALPGGFVRVKISGIGFSWKAGQHIFLSIPRLGLGQSHPFTIANDPKSFENDGERYIELYIHARSGITSKLLREAKKSEDTKTAVSLHILVSGPYGFPPLVDAFETVVFVCASSGASFNVPLFQNLARNPCCARRIFFYWVVRDPGQIEAFAAPILGAISSAEFHGVEVRVGVFITGSIKSEGLLIGSDDVDSSSLEAQPEICSSVLPTTIHSLPSQSLDAEKDHAPPRIHGYTASVSSSNSSLAVSPAKLADHSAVSITEGRRPLLDELVRPAVEGAYGESAVVGCGSGGFTAALRTYTAGLSDERAVHKGTGAQGLFLFTETYGW